MQTTDLEHTRWDTYYQGFTFREKETLDPIDLTDNTIIFSLKYKISDETFVIQENLSIDNAVNWICSLTLTKEQTEVLEIWDYYYDIEKTTLDWVREIILIWIFKLVYDITTHND